MPTHHVIISQNWNLFQYLVQELGKCWAVWDLNFKFDRSVEYANYRGPWLPEISYLIEAETFFACVPNYEAWIEADNR